jgi:hypothetical protein
MRNLKNNTTIASANSAKKQPGRNHLNCTIDNSQIAKTVNTSSSGATYMTAAAMSNIMKGSESISTADGGYRSQNYRSSRDGGEMLLKEPSSNRLH